MPTQGFWANPKRSGYIKSILPQESSRIMLYIQLYPSVGTVGHHFSISGGPGGRSRRFALARRCQDSGDWRDRLRAAAWWTFFFFLWEKTSNATHLQKPLLFQISHIYLEIRSFLTFCGGILYLETFESCQNGSRWQAEIKDIYRSQPIYFNPSPMANYWPWRPWFPPGSLSTTFPGPSRWMRTGMAPKRQEVWFWTYDGILFQPINLNLYFHVLIFSWLRYFWITC